MTESREVECLDRYFWGEEEKNMVSVSCLVLDVNDGRRLENKLAPDVEMEIAGDILKGKNEVMTCFAMALADKADGRGHFNSHQVAIYEDKNISAVQKFFLFLYAKTGLKVALDGCAVRVFPSRGRVLIRK